MPQRAPKRTSSPEGSNGTAQGNRTRTALLDAAEVALAESGYHATRVDDVVRVAGVSHGTFYLYFANKEDLFWALAQRCATEMEELTATLGQVEAGPEGRAHLRDWLGQFLALYRRHGAVIRAWAERHGGDRRLHALGAASFDHMVDGLAARMPPARVELGPIGLLALLERCCYLVTTRPQRFGDEELLDTLAGVVHRGWFGAAAG